MSKINLYVWYKCIQCNFETGVLILTFLYWFFSFKKCKSELVDLAENIQQKLSYFNELETINTVSMVFFFFLLFVKLVTLFVFSFLNIIIKFINWLEWYFNLIVCLQIDIPTCTPCRYHYQFRFFQMWFKQ